MRFGVAFLVGLLAALALGVGALYAYDQEYSGRVLPGVRVGSLDMSGLPSDRAHAAVADAYAGLATGRIVLLAGDLELSIPYDRVGRGIDAERVVGDALAIGRTGSPLERVIADARTALRGATVQPTVTFDPAAVVREVERLASGLDRNPVDAFVTTTEDGFVVTPATLGRRADRDAAVAAVLAAIGELDAPEQLRVDLPLVPVQPEVTTTEAVEAKRAAERMASPLVIAVGEETWKISAKRIRGWISFAPDGAGGYAPSADTTELPKVLKKLAKDIDTPAKNASFKLSKGKIVGVIPSKPGRGVDIEGTTALIEGVLVERAAGRGAAPVAPVMRPTEPALTTAEAEAVAPKMRKISSWTTYFPISEKNGYGANIWIPAMDLDGYVVGPRETFDFWKAVGPITRERGYRDGGAIINGKTEPQGALAGGICSCSTTLFNAALRAGYEMGARRNHYYYIDRYPLGLDATVFKSGSGSVQTMSFTNDTDYPVLIRGFKIRKGDSGYVRFELHSVPTGRKVSFSKPIVKDIRRAQDTVQYTSSLKPGVTRRVEYPVDGKKVWVTRTVRDKNGTVIHKDTYYSNYARITGVTLVGKGTPAASPSPTP
jgi:vancomycin resistance protein YoaR